MVAINNPFDKLNKGFEERKKQYERLKEISETGFISRRLVEYAGSLLVLDHLADEAEFYAESFEVYYAEKSLSEMKGRLDYVAGLFLSGGTLETESIDQGLSIVKNPNFENIPKYQELYDFAKQRYDEAVTKCYKLMGAAA